MTDRNIQDAASWKAQRPEHFSRLLR